MWQGMEAIAHVVGESIVEKLTMTRCLPISFRRSYVSSSCLGGPLRLLSDFGEALAVSASSPQGGRRNRKRKQLSAYTRTPGSAGSICAERAARAAGCEAEAARVPPRATLPSGRRRAPRTTAPAEADSRDRGDDG